MKYLPIIFVFFVHFAFSQTAEETFFKAKKSFDEENYPLARQYFKILINDDPKNAYATFSTFYYGIASYQMGETKLAVDAWKQIAYKSPRWKNLDELHYWLAIASWDVQDTIQSITYATKIQQPEVKEQIEVWLEKKLMRFSEVQLLARLYEQFPEEKNVARRYAALLSTGYQDEEAIRTLTEINDKFGLTSEIKPLKKDEYKVAVLLPFMYESLQNTQQISRNKFVMELYQGMVLAAEDLKKRGTKITLYPYDTKRSGVATKNILTQPEMLGYDLIVGPLYPEPVQLVNEFSLRNKINMINPLSGNSQIIENNPFSYLLKPTYETMAWVAAKYAIDSLSENKYVMIIYDEDDRFNQMADLYADIMENNGFKVVKKIGVKKGENRIVLETLTRSYQKNLSKYERDSISKIPRRFVKEELLVNKRDSIRYYEERFYLAPDSIGHLFVASSNAVTAANVVGGVEIRGDKLPIIGLGDWLNFNVITLDQFERLGIALIHPNHIKYESESYYHISKHLSETYRQPPSINHFTGYDLIWFTGTLLESYGVYFQTGLQNGTKISGRVFHTFQYGFARDNQLVPIVKLKDSSLQIVNDTYEEFE